MYQYKATLVRIVDGDTLIVAVDLGFDIVNTMTLRLYGLNAPERYTDQGKLATQFVESWFHTNAPDGVVTLYTQKDKKEKYGRYLATVVSTNGLANLNNELVQSDHAQTYLL